MMAGNDSMNCQYQLLDSLPHTRNCTTNDQAKPHPIVWIFIYTVIFVLSISGNTVVTWVLLRIPRNATNVFLVNLAASDLLLSVFCIPFTLTALLVEEFTFGAFMCRLIRYLQAVSVVVNSFTLVAISIERYYAICEPLHSRRWQTLTHAYTVSGITWLAALILMIPVAAFNQLIELQNKKIACREIWPESLEDRPLELSFTFFFDVIILVMPITIMSVAYFSIARKLWTGPGIERHKSTGQSQVANGRCGPASHEDDESAGVNSRQLLHEPSIDNSPCHIRVSNYERNLANKRKVVKMLLVVVLEYFICWSPIFIINTWMVIDYRHAQSHITSMTKLLLHLLSYISSCCNPITYCFMNSKFRQGFLSAFRCCARRPRGLTGDCAMSRRDWASTTTATRVTQSRYVNQSVDGSQARFRVDRQ